MGTIKLYCIVSYTPGDNVSVQGSSPADERGPDVVVVLPLLQLSDGIVVVCHLGLHPRPPLAEVTALQLPTQLLQENTKMLVSSTERQQDPKLS